VRAFFLALGFPLRMQHVASITAKSGAPCFRENARSSPGRILASVWGAEELARAVADVVLNSFTDRAKDHALAADLAALT
jgi:hypothetical protein